MIAYSKPVCFVTGALEEFFAAGGYSLQFLVGTIENETILFAVKPLGYAYDWDKHAQLVEHVLNAIDLWLSTVDHDELRQRPGVWV